MELNTIQTEGTWNEVAEALNDNFSKIDVAIKSGTGGGGGGTSIEDGSITTSKIANNAVTLDKVSKSIQESLYKADSAVQHHEVYDKGAIDGLLNDKVDKVSGKQLSTEDFTTILKQKLEALNNYDDSALSQAVQSLQTQLNTLTSGDASSAIESFNEIVAFLDGISDSQDLDSIIASIEQQIAAKQDAITDLETIREGASLGATAVQPEGLTDMVAREVTEKTRDFPTRSEVKETYAYRDKDDIQEILGISDWALASVKPTYTASEVGALGVNNTAANANKLGGLPLKGWDGTESVISSIHKSGVMEIGWLIDFHTQGQDSDFSTRLRCNGAYGNTINLPTSSGTLALTSDIPTNYLPLSGGTISGSITATSFIGNLTGNADSATKLATARTIWGRSFDGTQDITGNLISDIWGIKKDQTYNGIFIQSKNYAGTADIGNIFITAWNSNTLSSFNVWANKSIFTNNVAIGGTTADEKLHVHGNVKADGNLTVNGGTIGYDATNKIWNLSDSLNVGRALTVHHKLTVDMSSYGNSQIEMKTNAGKSTLVYVKDFDWRFFNDDWSVSHKILHSGNLKDYKLSNFTDDVVSDAVTAEVDDRMRNYMTRDELKLNYVYRNKDDIQETLGIADWALASENPSYTKAEMDTKLGFKQDTLVSSSTIKTINGESILGSGNIQINSDGTTSVVEVVLDVSKLTVGSNFTITQEQFDNIKASRFGRTVVIKEFQYSENEWGQVLSCYRLYVGSSVYAVRVSILHKDSAVLAGSADNAKLYNIDIMDYQSASGYSCQVTSINNLY